MVDDRILTPEEALAEALKKESLLVRDDSLLVLREFESLEDED